MSGYNLPPGCSVNDLPGNSNMDVYIENYTDEHYCDVDMFNEYIERETSKEFKVSRYGIADCRVSVATMKFLLEFGSLDDQWYEYLAECARDEYTDR